jgi:small subunit ribosomal protein S8
MLTRIRNAGMARKPETTMPSSKLLVNIARILKDEGYISDFRVEERKPFPLLHVELKYGTNRHHVIKEIRRISKPGLRVYVGKNEIPRVKSGLGIAIVSTPEGVLAGHEARRRGIGGEVLCTVW